MTYLEYLLLFIILPLLIVMGMIIINRHKQKEINNILSFIISVSLLSVIALVYTTPWDNYLVQHGIWYYDTTKILGIVFGYVPLEEYTYFILETILVSSVVFFMIQIGYIEIPEHISFKISKSKGILLSVLIISWIICLFSFIKGIIPMLYIDLLLLWGIPPILFQLLVGWELIGSNKSIIIPTIFVLGFYLSTTDFIAIQQGIWTISATFTIGINFVLLPLEEVVFFYITVILIVFGYIQFHYFVNRFIYVKDEEH